ncbi:MAG: copper resistance protein CopC [Actinomycetes bacterium]|tara:strand:+ start:1841 stop:2407 length:567 start_codon:yes stop_codon:yes gene_type:complete
MTTGRVIRSIIAGAIVILPIFSSSAFANNITASVPQAGSVLTTSPNSISISTAAALSEQGTLIVVNNPNGVAVDDGSITINGNSAEVGLTELITTGVYTVNYTLLSDTDDPLTGSYTFRFNAPSSVGSPSPSPTQSNTETAAENMNLNGGSNAFVYTLLAIAAFVFVFLIWYAMQTFGRAKRSPKNKR